MEILDALVSMAVDLTATLNAKDRYQRLLAGLGRVIPYNAAALLVDIPRIKFIAQRRYRVN